MTTKQIRKLGAKEPFERKIEVHGDKVTMTRAVKPNEKSEDRYVVEVTLDFAGVSPEDRLALASNTAWITVQRRWRAAFAANRDAALSADRWSAVDVQRDLTEAPRTGDPVTKAMRAIDKLDDATKDAVIKRYLDEMKGAKRPKAA